ncbi:PASTA domain-containing protein [Plantactinospora endophytica]|uniref:PASTA domain-containing protein n=1 Tax=Plantactinospora endophytica TaxID=673535 RepID=A0ABQ4EEK5_9ACTN|nr:PASTA domain-containing protein [Plantactinospora endophytica]GIG93161.1 hypothetical protein Pen02_80970 [Plantactinospora endophytica]
MTYQQEPHTPPPAKNNRTLIIAAAAVGIAVVLVCGVCGIVAMVTGGEPSTSTSATSEAKASSAPVVTPVPTTPAAAPTTEAPPPAPTTPAGPIKVKVPNLVGKNAAVAEDELRALGFTRIDFGSEDEEDTFVILRANWTVTKQSAKAGTSVPVDTLIVLTCTKKQS